MDGGSHNLFTLRRLKLFKKVLDNKKERPIIELVCLYNKLIICNTARKYRKDCT